MNVSRCPENDLNIVWTRNPGGGQYLWNIPCSRTDKDSRLQWQCSIVLHPGLKRQEEKWCSRVEHCNILMYHQYCLHGVWSWKLPVLIVNPPVLVSLLRIYRKETTSPYPWSFVFVINCNCNPSVTHCDVIVTKPNWKTFRQLPNILSAASSATNQVFLL